MLILKDKDYLRLGSSATFVAVLLRGRSGVLMYVPHQISYHYRLTSSSGISVPDGEYQAVFTIWKDSVSRSPPGWD